ncbi:T6SS phospholipase effector Tle1-like catalytic domain-containing protein [Klebsiella oxytoca]|uniref:T6SS phospholipase effector Tle1-like catalytic domain-containing protein n=1 Tax=Klebsiella oxytoca TaxID=571 RepID=UPI00374E01FB
MEGTSGNKYYKYYIPGVGTPFPEVSDLNYSTPGMAFATYGEERINWALIRIIDTLRRTLGKPALSDNESWKAVKDMTSRTEDFGASGQYRRPIVFRRLLKDLEPDLKLALNQPEPGKPKLLGIKLYVYGFSRGAAAARAFVNWLVELLPNTFSKGAKPDLCLTLEGADWKVPLSVEFLGLLDTVASVGVAHIAPLAEGHMGWADNAMELPDNGLIKNCVHLVSAHEQRLCFPLDSICRHDGTYPSYAREMVYPGMHSDIGGGYTPGDQGKSVAADDGYLLSQIALHDMYAAAFNAGAPLKVFPTVLPKDLLPQTWRIMPAELQREFFVDLSLVNRFNAWRELTLNLPSSLEKINDENAARYEPVRASVNVITALEVQITWITAWRIGRYASGNYTKQRFYIDAAANGMDKDSDPKIREASEQARDIKQRKVEKTRRKMQESAEKDTYIPYPPGPKDFDPALGQTQLRQAAEEFREDYQLKQRAVTGNWGYKFMDKLSNLVYTFSDDDVSGEYIKIKKEANEKYSMLFPPQGESSNEQQPGGLVRALFDDQVHDSRAWFMQATLDAREPWGSYFLYRMIYFGELMSKNITPLVKYGRFIEGRFKDTVPGVDFIIERAEKGGAIMGENSPPEIKQKISVVNSSADIPLTMLSDLPLQPALTNEPAELIAWQQQSREAEKLASTKAAIASLWP